MPRSLTLLALAATLVVAGCTDTPTPDAPPADGPAATAAESGPASGLVDVAGARADVLLGTAVVRATRVELSPGDSLAAHDGGDRVVYALTPFTLIYTENGVTEAERYAAGDAHEHAAGRHAVRNSGTTPAEFVVFERIAGSQIPAIPDAATTLLEAAGAAAETVLRTPFAEVHRVTLQPAAALPPHTGAARVVYTLSGYTVEFTGADGTRERSFAAGEVHDHDPGDHTVENAGDTAAEFLVVEFKR